MGRTKAEARRSTHPPAPPAVRDPPSPPPPEPEHPPAENDSQEVEEESKEEEEEGEGEGEEDGEESGEEESQKEKEEEGEGDGEEDGEESGEEESQKEKEEEGEGEGEEDGEESGEEESEKEKEEETEDESEDESQAEEEKESEDESEEEESEEASRANPETGSGEGLTSPRGVMPPLGFYIKKDQYPRNIKVATRCYIAKTVTEIEKRLDSDEMDWFRNHPQFNHFLHMPRDITHKSMGLWMLILRMARIEKKKELWFIVNGVPIRYSMREHALISGLFCHEYERNWEDVGNLQFVNKHFKDEEKVTQEMVEAKFFSMRNRTNDRLKMAVLYFLTQVIKGVAKRGKEAPGIDPFLKRIVTDLDKCRDFPWGRYTFFDNLNEVERMVALFKDGVVNKACNLPSFIVPLELLAFEAIPSLGNFFRTDVSGAKKRCPRMCKGKFKSWSLRGFPIEDIYRELGETTEIDSILQETRVERHLISDMEEEDDVVDAVVDGWNHRLLVEKQPIYFDDLLKEDIKMRTVEKKGDPKGKKVGEQSNAGSGVEEMIGLKELQETMLLGFKEVNEKLESVHERLSAVESSVSEVVRLVQDQEKNAQEDSDEEMGEAAEKEKDGGGDDQTEEVAAGKEKDGGGDDQIEEVAAGKDKDGGGDDQIEEVDAGKEKDGGGDDQIEEVDAGKDKDGGGDEQTKDAAKDQGKKKQGKRKGTYSDVVAYSRPNTRQRSKEAKE